MKKKEFLNQIKKREIDKKKIQRAEKVYAQAFPLQLQQIVSFCGETVFLEDSVRILSFTEILDAKKDLHVDFSAKGILPIADCGDNDFIVYLFADDKWAKFNIIEEVLFKKKDKLSMLL